MKRHNIFGLRRAIGYLMVSIMMLAVMNPAQAKKTDPSDHPIKVLKARYQSTGRSMGSSKGSLTIWLKNMVGVTVDGIEIEVDLYNDRRRKVETVRRKVKELGAGEKKVVTIKWDVVAEKIKKPRFYVEYNRRGNQKSRFEGESPNWQ